MCKFLSAIVMRSGDILCDPINTDSHEDLLQAHNIRDTDIQSGRFARVEFTPPEDLTTIMDLSTWTLRVDEDSTPDWFDAVRVREDLSSRIQRMLITDHREFLLGGCWILAGEGKVDTVKNTRIVSMHDTSQVRGMYGNSQVVSMYDTSQVGSMDDNSQVVSMYDTSQVGRMDDTSQVGWMHGNARIINDLRKK